MEHEPWSPERYHRGGVDTGYGGGFQVQADAPDAMACELMEDDGEFRVHEPPVARRPRRLAFVDGTMRVEARLTRTDDHGTVTGLAGSWGAGAVLVDSDRPLPFDRVTVGRAAIFTTGQRVELPPQRYVNTHHRPITLARTLFPRRVRPIIVRLMERDVDAIQGAIRALDEQTRQLVADVNSRSAWEACGVDRR